jgi:formylglycine-generating enzyme required for sulfatase activity
MRRLIQHSLGWATVVVLTACALMTPAPKPAPARAAEPTPSAPGTAHKAYTEKIPDTDVTFDLVPIPGGTYLMGSPPAEKGRGADEGPQHPVTVKPFWMGKCEVRWDEFDPYWRKRPGGKEDKEPENPVNADAVTRPTPAYEDETFVKLGGGGREGYPVLCISHHTAMQYCRWLSLKTGKVYRLPTEAEWEWAARAGTKTAYFFGEGPAKLGEYAWYAANSDDKTHKVGEKKPNPWGLYDIYGNVAEWCVDHYDKDYYKKFPTDKPTVGPVLLPSERRWSHVVRGGSWAEEPPGCRSAVRRGSDKSWIQLDPQRPQSIWWLTSADFVGFRVVRAVEEQDNLKGLRSKVTRESR